MRIENTADQPEPGPFELDQPETPQTPQQPTTPTAPPEFWWRQEQDAEPEPPPLDGWFT